MGREELIVFLALAELNEKKQENLMYMAMKCALIELQKEMLGGGG